MLRCLWRTTDPNSRSESFVKAWSLGKHGWRPCSLLWWMIAKSERAVQRKVCWRIGCFHRRWGQMQRLCAMQSLAQRMSACPNHRLFGNFLDLRCDPLHQRVARNLAKGFPKRSLLKRSLPKRLLPKRLAPWMGFFLKRSLLKRSLLKRSALWTERVVGVKKERRWRAAQKTVLAWFERLVWQRKADRGWREFVQEKGECGLAAQNGEVQTDFDSVAKERVGARGRVRATRETTVLGVEYDGFLG